jgi:hypothetical protein
MLIAVVVDLDVALLVEFEGHALRQAYVASIGVSPKAFGR